MQEDTSRSPSYTVVCDDYVNVVEFSPFTSGTPVSLLAYGGNQYVVVGTCLFPVRLRPLKQLIASFISATFKQHVFTGGRY